MKNFIITLVFVFQLAFLANAQDAKVASLEINKVPQPCVVATYSITADVVEGALRKKMSDAGLGKGEKTKDGFRVYKGVVVQEIIKDKIDFYYKIEDKKNSTLLYVLTSRGYDNFLKMDPDSAAVKNTIYYLNAFVKDAMAFLLNNQIAAQNEVVKDADKKLKNSVKEGESLVSYKAKVESKIAKNAIEMSALKTEMENQQKALELVRQKTATIEEVKQLKKEVDKQESVTKKATKKYNNSVDDSADYKEDLSKTEKQIADNINEQERLKTDLENQKLKVEDLKTQLGYLK